MATAKKIKTPKISHANGGSRWIGVFLLGALLGGVGWFAFDYGREWAGLSASDTDRTARLLRNTVSSLEKERDELRRQIAVLERSSQVDREASRMAQVEFKKLQEEKQELEKDVQFLRNLLEDESAGILRVKDFKLTSVGNKGKFSYSFTVSQLKENFGVSEGRVVISVSGSSEGAEKTLDLKELTKGRRESHGVRFRHFQKFKEEIVLPDGFAPVSVNISVEPKTKKLAPLSQTFDWSVGG